MTTSASEVSRVVRRPNFSSPVWTLRLPDLGWCLTIVVWLHTRLLNCLCYRHLRKCKGRYLRFLLGIRRGFLELLLFHSAFFPNSPTRSLALWEDHNPQSATASFQPIWRVKLILKGRLSQLSSWEFLSWLLWRLEWERRLLLCPMLCSTVRLAVWSPPSLHPYGT